MARINILQQCFVSIEVQLVTVVFWPVMPFRERKNVYMVKLKKQTYKHVYYVYKFLTHKITFFPKSEPRGYS